MSWAVSYLDKPRPRAVKEITGEKEIEIERHRERELRRVERDIEIGRDRYRCQDSRSFYNPLTESVEVNTV